MIYQVLIIDDEEIVCRGLREFVKWNDHGFEVTDIAYSADEALSILEKKYVDVIFTDIKMPGKTGLDLLEIVSKEYPDIKPVILSGHSDFQFAKKALQYGAVDYLTKPVNLKEVETLLDKIHSDIEQETKNAAVKKKRTDSLLLGAAKGYISYEKELHQNLDIENWYGVAVGLQKKEFDILEDTMQNLQNKLSAVLAGAILLPYETSKIFILLPCENKQILEETIELLKNMACEEESCFWGISNIKYGMEKISEGFYEANQALNYMLVRKKEDTLFYKNIETLYEEAIPNLSDFLSEIIGTMTNNESREEAYKKVTHYLFDSYNANMDLSKLQLMCIRGFIEIQGYLQNMQAMQDGEVLNRALSDFMKSNSYKELEDKVILYMESLISEMDNQSKTQLSTGVIREVQLYIQQHYGDDISLQSLAKEFYIHPNYLSRLFKEKTGENFVDYLTKIRMNKVIELLTNTNYKIVEICEMVGYDNPRYFSKAFKQFFGKTPREYRDMN